MKRNEFRYVNHKLGVFTQITITSDFARNATLGTCLFEKPNALLRVIYATTTQTICALIEDYDGQIVMTPIIFGSDYVLRLQDTKIADTIAHTFEIAGSAYSIRWVQLLQAKIGHKLLHVVSGHQTLIVTVEAIHNKIVTVYVTQDENLWFISFNFRDKTKKIFKEVPC